MKCVQEYRYAELSVIAVQIRKAIVVADQTAGQVALDRDRYRLGARGEYMLALSYTRCLS